MRFHVLQGWITIQGKIYKWYMKEGERAFTVQNGSNEKLFTIKPCKATGKKETRNDYIKKQIEEWLEHGTIPEQRETTILNQEYIKYLDSLD